MKRRSFEDQMLRMEVERRLQAHPVYIDGKHIGDIRDADDPETFYDYVGEWREGQRQRRVLKWVAFAAFLGLVIGVGVLIFAWVH